MKHIHVGRPQSQVEIRPRKAGPVPESVRCPDTGYIRKDSAKLGTEPVHPARLHLEIAGSKAELDSKRRISTLKAELEKHVRLSWTTTLPGLNPEQRRRLDDHAAEQGITTSLLLARIIWKKLGSLPDPAWEAERTYFVEMLPGYLHIYLPRQTLKLLKDHARSLGCTPGALATMLIGVKTPA